MDQRPPQPPEGKLIADAATRLDLSIREAARRAGLSYGRWRQITSGYQNVSPGSYAPVRAPARTLAKMAAAVRVAPEQMETQGQRPDAAAVMRENARPAPLADPAGAPRATTASPRPPGRGTDPSLDPWRQQVLREVYSALGIAARFSPREDLPEPWDLPGVEDALLALPGALMFEADHEVLAWDNPRIPLWRKIDTIALTRQLWARAEEDARRRTGLGRMRPAAIPVFRDAPGQAARA